MLTSLIFVVSLILLLRRFKSKRSRVIIGVLYCSFLIWYVQAIFNYGKYTLQPGQSVELRVHPNTEQVEFYSELILKKLNNAKIKLSGRKSWGTENNNIVYNVKNQTTTELIFSENGTEHKILANDKSKSMYLEKDGIVLQGKLSEVFLVTDEKSYSITITNVDDKPAKFEAQVADHL